MLCTVLTGFPVIWEIYREYQGRLLLRWNPMLSQKSLKTVSTAPDSDEAHATLAKAQVLAPSMTFGLGSKSRRAKSAHSLKWNMQFDE